MRNQIEGGAVQATSWTIKERVRFDRRRVTSDAWETYPILRFSEAPPSTSPCSTGPASPSLGAGEAAQGPTAAAIANAVRRRDRRTRPRPPPDPEAVLTALDR